MASSMAARSAPGASGVASGSSSSPTCWAKIESTRIWSSTLTKSTPAAASDEK